jgi:hypothetical protein
LIVCATLAADPVEVVDGRHGVRVDKIIAPQAVAACERAVDQNPNAASAWRHLARSYAAGVRYWGLEGSTYEPRFVEALQKAASLGDKLAQVELALFNNYRGRFNRADAAAEQRELLRAMGGDGKVPVETFARLKLEAALHANEVNRIAQIKPFDAKVTAWDAYFGSGVEDDLEARMDAIGPLIGWQALHDHIWEMRDRRQCGNYDRMCGLFDNALLGSKDVPTFLAISVDSLAGAYRNAEIAFEKVRTEGYDREVALNVGYGWARASADYANRAWALGNPQQKKAAEDLLAAKTEFSKYNNSLSRMARQEAKEAQDRAWQQLAALVIGAVVLSGQSSSSVDYDAQSWAEENQRRSCDIYEAYGGTEWDAAQIVGCCN